MTTVLGASDATVVAGDVLATIADDRPARLVGFLRQPLPREAHAGQAVELRVRHDSGRRVNATIGELGRVLEPVATTILALYHRGHAAERGLRVQIALPTGFAVRPGELVDVVLRAP